METTQPLISIIILNYNQLDVTCAFLESTKSLTYKNFEIILIDNASEQNPTRIIEENYPNVKLVVNEVNTGSTGGNNQGIRLAKGDYVFLLNNDTEVTPDLLEKCLEPFLNDASIGMVSPKILYYDKPDIIQYAGYTKINPFTGRNSVVGGKEKDMGQHDVSGYTNYAHGAAMLVKREVIDKTGMYPEHFFIYYEELDWSARAIKAGYKICYQADTKIYHKESVTMGKESAIKAYYHTRNRIMFMRRNTSYVEFFIFLLFVVFFIVPKNCFKYIINSQWTHLKNFLRGLVWNLTTSKHIDRL